MGLKSDSHTSRYPKDSTRGAKGKQDVITKQLIETTRCTIAEAEEALAECNFDIELAVNYIFD
uniref:UBA domain-containing protein n=1 Tax=Panagrolaimus sp. JU765 TaxID=591449 RepID=A0AC34Q7G7_9BILA